MWTNKSAALALAALRAAGTLGTAQAQNEIVIGGLYAMSGQGLTYGRIQSQGAQLAIDEINAAGGVNGRKLRLEIGDHKSGEVKAATSEMSRMVSIYKVAAVLPSFSAPTLAAQAMAVESDVVLINGGGFSPQLLNKKFLWNNRLTSNLMAVAALKEAWAGGARSLCMIYRQDPSGIDTAAAARDWWTKQGGKVLCEEKYDIAANNFGAQISKIRSLQPNALATFAYGQQAGIIIKQARDFGYTGPLFGIDFLEENITQAGKAIEGMTYATDEFNLDSTEPVTAKFVKSYRDRYKENPDLTSANYYEAVYVLRDAMLGLAKANKPITGTNLDAAIRQMRTFATVYGGKMTFNDDGSVQKPITVFQIRDSKKVVLKRVLN